MALLDEIVAIEAFIKAKYPAAKYEKQTVPDKPAHDTFVIRFLDDDREKETGVHYRIDREYQVIYFAQTPQAILPVMDALSKYVYSTDSIGPYRVESFAYSQPFKMESGMHACIGILTGNVREAIPQKSWQKINHIGTRFE
ncbi:hypothetical protein ACFSVM_20305 [Paenibacillus shunpengii]|uniref:Uncharacterized protein n=1 Tax=Paenibacillus shunpengii TaxID=2054424 RepID=A0ABW5SSV0_9BACL